jgi:xanthosine utilization system XapX-like protein
MLAATTSGLTVKIIFKLIAEPAPSWAFLALKILLMIMFYIIILLIIRCLSKDDLKWFKDMMRGKRDRNFDVAPSGSDYKDLIE